MSAIFQFLEGISNFFSAILNFDVMPGVTGFTVLFYHMLLIVFVSAFTRKS